MSSTNIPLNSSEVANLWMVYQEKTALLRFMEHFLVHADPDVRPLFQASYDSSMKAIGTLKRLFEEAGAAVPIGFSDCDVNKNAPKLFDFLYDAMFLHMMTKIETGLFAFFSTMAYRSDVADFFHQITTEAQEAFKRSTQLLLDKGVLVRPPYMSMPKEVSYITDDHYLSGFSLLRDARSLNAIESSIIHHAIETNLTGMQLMIGFAQVAQDQDAKEYFIKGMELSKEIETTLGEFLRREFIEPPASHAGKATSSTIPPFSDKLMMFVTSLLTSFGLGSNALGSAFSLRSDIPVTLSRLALLIFDFARKSGALMIKKGWMEAPPQIEDRRKLTKA